MSNNFQNNNVINYQFIDYIIKSHMSEAPSDNKPRKINMDLFKEAMLHFTTKFKDHHRTYERLEFLGDSFFHLAIAEYLYKRYDEEDEGFLTRLRIRIERGDSMAELTKILKLDNYVQIFNISMNDHILEDVFEAFIGAFYLNFYSRFTTKFIISLIEKHKNLAEMIFFDDNYKDLLLRYFHQMKWGHPKYEDNYDDNNDKKFVSIVRNPFGKILGTGSAASKKKAEQNASKKALIKLEVIVDGEIDPDWIGKIEKVEKEEKERVNKGKKPLSVYNSANKLINRTIIKKLLNDYNVPIKKDAEINVKLFCEAMTHRSYLIRKKVTDEDKKASVGCVKLQKKSNERLEFLGDAVIHFIIAEYLYHKYPEADEGFLTRLRCKLENADALFYLAKQTDISSYVLINQTIEVAHGRNNVNIIGSGFEAFIGGLYLQFGFQVARQFVLEVIRVELNIDEIAENETNYKDLILQLYNKNGWGHPIYKIIKEQGPDHNKIFTMGLYLNGKIMGRGKAPSKKKGRANCITRDVQQIYGKKIN